MPNVRAQRLTKDELYIMASDGREVTITRAQALAKYQSLSGTKAVRLAATVQWIKGQIVVALGVEQVGVDLIDCGFDNLQGLTRLTMRASPDMPWSAI